MRQDIQEALTKDAELSKEDYAEARKAAAETAATQTGTEVEELTEEEKHRRIEMNFYGTVVNFLLKLTQLVDHLPERIADELMKREEVKKE